MVPLAFVQMKRERQSLDFMFLVRHNVLPFFIENIYSRLGSSLKNKHVSSILNIFSALQPCDFSFHLIVPAATSAVHTLPALQCGLEDLIKLRFVNDSAQRGEALKGFRCTRCWEEESHSTSLSRIIKARERIIDSDSCS